MTTNIICNIGFDKCGTSWFEQYTRFHPAIGVTSSKQIGTFFKERTSYHEHMCRHSDFDQEKHSWICETNHEYIYDKQALINLKSSQAKIVVMTRDPIEKFRSHHLYLARSGYDLTFDFEIDVLKYPELLERVKFAKYVEQVRSVFTENNILELTLEEVFESEIFVQRKICQFLNLEPLTTDIGIVRSASLPKSKVVAKLGNVISKLLKHVGLYKIHNRLKKLNDRFFVKQVSNDVKILLTDEQENLIRKISSEV